MEASNGQPLVFIYYRDDGGRPAAATLPTSDTDQSASCHVGSLMWALTKDGDPWPPPPHLMASVNGAILLRAVEADDDEVSLLAFATVQ